MKTPNAGNCSIEVEQGRVVVSMEGRPVAANQEELSAKDFDETPLSEATVVEGVIFYAAKNAKGEMKRCVTSTINDRKAVAALVAGWIAEGFRVESLTAKDLKRQIAAIEKAEKEAAMARDAAANREVEPGAGSGASVETGNAAPEPAAPAV